MARRVLYNSVVNGQIPVGTNYLKSDGSLTTTAADAWLRRDDQEATYIHYTAAGGGTTLSVEHSNDLAAVVTETLLGSFTTPKIVDTPHLYIRVKIVQSTSPTTTALLFVD